MELKAFLNIPYTIQQRIDFIIENNHNKGYEIKETSQRIEAWGYTEEEIQEQEKQNLINQLIQQLEEIDLKTVRPLRAIQSGQGTQEDHNKLLELEQQAENIRRQIQDLTPEEPEEESEPSIENNEENNI